MPDFRWKLKYQSSYEASNSTGGGAFTGNANWEESPISGTFKNAPCTLKLLNTGVYVDSNGNVEVRVKYRITNNETDEVREDYCNFEALLNKNYVF